MIGDNFGYELLVKIAADITSLQNGLSQAATKIGGFGKQITQVGKEMSILGGSITTAVLGTYKAFNDYEEKLVDMAKVTDQSFEEIETAIKSVDPVLGNMTELMEGYYQVISAGVTEPKEAIDLLTTSAELAKSAHLDQAEAVKALTKLLAGYGDELGDVASAADLLFGMEKVGQTTVAELTPLIGGLATVSHELNISASEMGGAVSLITRTAGSTAEAATMYEGIMTGLLKPTGDMTEAFNKIGESVRGVGEGYEDAASMLADLGFVESMKKLQEYCETTGITLGDLFGRKEAMVGFMALADDSFKTLEGTVQGVSESTGDAKKNFEEWSKTGQAAMDEMKSSLSNLSIVIGDNFAPMMTNIINKISELIPKIIKWVESHKPLVENLGKLGLALAVGGPVLIGIGMLTTGMTALLSPIGLVLVAVTGLAAAWTTDFHGTRTKTLEDIEAIKGAFLKLKDFISGLIDSIKGFFGDIFDFLDSIGDKVKGIIDKIKGAFPGKIEVNPNITGGVDISEASFPSHAAGISYVPQTGLALLHKGEAVIPASQNQAGAKSYTININNPVIRNDDDISKIRQQFEESMNGLIPEFGRSGNYLVPGMA